MGNIVASNGIGGPIVRSRVIPFNPKSVAQVNARARLIQFSQAWSALTPAQRIAWNGAVENWKNTDVFGNSLTPSGFNLYVALNVNLDIIGVAPIDTPPAVTAVPVLTSLAATMVAATSVSLATVPTTLVAGAKYVICATAPMSQGRSGAGSSFRIIAIASPGAFSPYNAKSAYEAVHGSGYLATQKVFFKVYGIDSTTGKMGAAVECECIVS
jgi:hypothetical protein